MTKLINFSTKFKSTFIAGAVVSATVFVPAVYAAEYRSVSDVALIGYDAPSQQAKKQWLLSRGTPVQILVSLADGWAKVKESGGDWFWVEKKSLSDVRTVQITLAGALVYGKASTMDAPIAQLEKNAILEYVETGPAGWVKVKLQDKLAENSMAYIKAADLWGE
jgi:SH3-like domain-containing protein